VGTLLGLFMGLSVFGVVFLLVIFRFRGTKFEPRIRVDIVNSQSPTEKVSPHPVNSDRLGAQRRRSNSATETEIVGFGERDVPFPPLGNSSEEREKVKAQKRNHQEQEILKQILEENTRFMETCLS
jgi:hypothetical protein